MKLYRENLFMLIGAESKSSIMYNSSGRCPRVFTTARTLGVDVVYTKIQKLYSTNRPGWSNRVRGVTRLGRPKSTARSSAYAVQKFRTRINTLQISSAFLQIKFVMLIYLKEKILQCINAIATSTTLLRCISLPDVPLQERDSLLGRRVRV